MDGTTKNSAPEKSQSDQGPVLHAQAQTGPQLQFKPKTATFTSGSTPPAWMAHLANFKATSLFKGVNITPAHLMLCLFLFFFFWLFVVYWIRHNEPLANQVLGSPHAFAPTALHDRHLINSVKGAYPVHTSPTAGQIWTPPIGIHGQSALGGPAPVQSSSSSPWPSPVQTSSPQAAQAYGAPATQPYMQTLQMRSAQPYAPQTMPAQPYTQGWDLANGGYQQAPAQYMTQFGAPMTGTMQALPPAQGVYHVPVVTPSGPRLKLYTNR
jgi:hypothetical protein